MRQVIKNRMNKGILNETGGSDFTELLHDISQVGNEYSSMSISVYNSKRPSKNDDKVVFFITDHSVVAEIRNDRLELETRGGEMRLSIKDLVNIDYNALTVTGSIPTSAFIIDVELKDKLYKFLFREK